MGPAGLFGCSRRGAVVSLTGYGQPEERLRSEASGGRRSHRGSRRVTAARHHSREVSRAPRRAGGGFFDQHEDDACRARGTTTRSPETFKGAMAWARTMGQHATDPGFSPLRVRWFLDVSTALGTLLTGKPAAANPAAGSALDDVEHTADALLARTKRSLENAVGTHKVWAPVLAAALVPDPALDARISVLRQLAAQITAWLKAPAAPPLAGFDVDAKTAAALVAAAKTLDAAIAVRPPPAQFDRDSPAINAAEGRLYFIMRVLWTTSPRPAMPARRASSSR